MTNSNLTQTGLRAPENLGRSGPQNREVELSYMSPIGIFDLFLLIRYAVSFSSEVIMTVLAVIFFERNVAEATSLELLKTRKIELRNV